MGTFSIWHWLIVLAVVLILFGGGGKLSRLMGDFGKGLKAFKSNVKDGGDKAETEGDPKKIEAETGPSGESQARAETETPKDKAANG